MKINEITNIDVEYYMTEGCGIFALALAKLTNTGVIGIFSDPDGERWSSSIPFEVTHVVYVDTNGQMWDATGKTSKQKVEEYLGTQLKANGGFKPDVFKSKFVGSNDRFPLYGSPKDIKEAMNLIVASDLFKDLLA